LIGVNVVGHEPAKLKQVMDKEKLNWRSFAGRAASARWSASTPTYYILDRHGVIHTKWVGNPGAKAIEVALEKLIAEAEKDGKKK
jgi:hypothetical protein